MESPRIHGDAEEKSSCESGWTMYIEDTFQGNHHSDDDDYGDDGDDDDDDAFRAKEVDDDDDDDSSNNESDDSMTSDASSWPSTQLSRKAKNHAPAKNHNVKQVNHQTKIRSCEKFRDEEEESELKAKTRTTAASRVQSRGKVSKTK